MERSYNVLAGVGRQGLCPVGNGLAVLTPPQSVPARDWPGALDHDGLGQGLVALPFNPEPVTAERKTAASNGSETDPYSIHVQHSAGVRVHLEQGVPH